MTLFGCAKRPPGKQWRSFARAAASQLFLADNRNKYKILDWLKRIGRENRLCLRYLRIDYAYGTKQERMMCAPLSDKMNQSWPNTLPVYLNLRSPKVICQSCRKLVLRMVNEVKSVIQLLDQDQELSRFEILTITVYCLISPVSFVTC